MTATTTTKMTMELHLKSELYLGEFACQKEIGRNRNRNKVIDNDMNRDYINTVGDFSSDIKTFHKLVLFVSKKWTETETETETSFAPICK